MAEIGSGSGSSYPGALDTEASQEVDSPAAGKTKARAAVPNDLASCIVAIETELGIDPAGTRATLVARLSTSLESDGGPKDTVIVTVSGSNQQISGHKVFTSGIATGIWGIKGTATVGVSGQVVVTGSGALLASDGIDPGGHGFKIKTKIVEIGNWNMDLTENIGLAHGLTLANIRGASVMIRNDAATSFITFPTYSPPGTTGEFIDFQATNVFLNRSTSGNFDNVSYDSTGFNRGWIIIDYV